jgi:hypothetical protein
LLVGLVKFAPAVGQGEESEHRGGNEGGPDPHAGTSTGEGSSGCHGS